MLSWHKDDESKKKAGIKGRSNKEGLASSQQGFSSHKRLGEILLEDGLITLEQLAEALKIQSETGKFLGCILIEKGYISKEAISSCLIKQCRVPHINPKEYDISNEVLRLIPEEVCRRRNLIPIDKLGRILTVAMVDPLDTEALEEVKTFCSDLRIKPILCSWEDLQEALDKAFKKGAKIIKDEYSSIEIGSGVKDVDATYATLEEPPSVPEEVLEELEKGVAQGPKSLRGDSVQEPSQLLQSPVNKLSSESALSSPHVVIDTSVVQAIQELPRILSESIRESLTQITINIPPPQSQISDSDIAKFYTLLGELKESFSVSVRELMDKIHFQLGQDIVNRQTELVNVLRENVAGVIQEAIASMIVQFKSELTNLDKNSRSTSEQLVGVFREGITILSNQILEGVSKEIGISTNAVAQMSSELAKSLNEVANRLERLDSTVAQTELVSEKIEGTLNTVRDSIIEGIQSSLEKSFDKLMAELKSQPKEAEPDPIIVELASVIKKLDQAISENRKVQELQSSALAQLSEKVVESIHATSSQTIDQLRELHRRVDLEVDRKKEEKTSADILIPELKQVVEELKESVQKTKEVHEEQAQKIARLTETTLESVQQTTQLVETLTILEGKRIETLEEKKRRLSSVAPFGKTSSEPPPEANESDKEVWKALESEQPLETLTFDNFFPGSANAFTFKLSKAVAENPGTEYNPFFLYGNVGIGKTHLISAIGNEILKTHPKMRVGYVSASHFARRLSEALREGALDLFRENYCHWDVLILDDIQFMGGKVEAQEEFFHVFNVLHHSKRQIIIASDKAPDKLGMLEQRLVSRFASGIVAELKAPEWETRMQILRNQVREAGVQVPEEVLGLIAMRVPNDVRKMMGSLKKIIAFARLVGQSITCEMADEILSHLGTTAAA
ncbi:MAG: DnaA/Hda family protein [Candidatus Hydrogenedentes bacterium]|nr:DnaA/Hda family protein [Candidatus Hydrogenedentota bacterium]